MTDRAESEGRHILVVGASGVIGATAVEHFARQPGWQVTALSRRAPVVTDGLRFAQVSADLTDRQACADVVSALPAVTHLVYAAVAERPGLRSGWFDEELIAANGAMFENILDPLAAAGHMRHVSLLQGTKAYGAHHHPVEVPCREDRPRDPHANFYWLHEDHARRRAAQHGFGFTIFRPQVLIGGAPGAAMNPAVAIGAYAALCRELGRDFVFPGHSDGVMELVDTALLAEAFDWAQACPGAWGETYNVTNGDVMVLSHAWPHVAGALGLEVGEAAPVSLATFFAEPETRAAWDRLVARHALNVPDLEALLGQSHHYVDLLLGARVGAKAVPTLLSTIKLRKAGFAACRDSLDALIGWLRWMSEMRLLPPLR